MTKIIIIPDDVSIYIRVGNEKQISKDTLILSISEAIKLHFNLKNKLSKKVPMVLLKEMISDGTFWIQ